jgi:hypothetical protein
MATISMLLQISRMSLIPTKRFQFLKQVIDNLSTIEEKLDEGFSFQGDNLRVALQNTKIVVTAQGGDGLSTFRGQDNTILSA